MDGRDGQDKRRNKVYADECSETFHIGFVLFSRCLPRILYILFIDV